MEGARSGREGTLERGISEASLPVLRSLSPHTQAWGALCPQGLVSVACLYLMPGTWISIALVIKVGKGQGLLIFESHS